MKTSSFESIGGLTGTIELENETYLIIRHKEGSTEAIEIDLKKRLIKTYDNKSWTFLPMNADQQFDENARLINHIDQL